MFIPSKPNKNKTNVASAKTAVAADLKASKVLPSHDDISQRAYAIYLSGGRTNGQDQQDWFQAEKEFFGLRKQ